MKEYIVTIPIVGYVTKIIEAESEKDAINAGLKESPFGKMETANGWELQNIDTYRYVFQGNVSHIEVSEATAEEYEWGGHMRVYYDATIMGEVEIPNEELEGKTQEERDEIVAEYVTARANEDLDTNLDWEIGDDEEWTEMPVM